MVDASTRAVEHVQRALQQHIADATSRAAPAAQDAVKAALSEMALVVAVQLRTLLPTLLEQAGGGGAPSPFGAHDWASCGSLDADPPDLMARKSSCFARNSMAAPPSARPSLARTGLAAYAAGQLAASVHAEHSKSASSADLNHLAQTAMQMLEQEAKADRAAAAAATGGEEELDEPSDAKGRRASVRRSSIGRLAHIASVSLESTYFSRAPSQRLRPEERTGDEYAQRRAERISAESRSRAHV
jgi:hypothetical protein